MRHDTVRSVTLHYQPPGPFPANPRQTVAFEYVPGGRAGPPPTTGELVFVPSRFSRTLLTTVAAVLADSPDPLDRAAVGDLGSVGAAERLLACVPEWPICAPDQWWECCLLAGEPVGFVLPVVFDGTRRDGRDEGTIFHVGVVPPYRGRGIGRMLLRRATEQLIEHGVWRIVADTAVENAPMIRLFESEGWRRTRPD